MRELPEVETTRRGVEPRVRGAMMVEIIVRRRAVPGLWHAGGKVWDLQGVSLEERLSTFKGQVLDLDVLLTHKGHSVRLIAIGSSEETKSRRRAKGKDRRKRMGNTATKQSLAREGWNLYVTDLSREEFEARDIVAIYEGRWAIEIRFRAPKGSARLRELLQRRTSKTALRVLLTAVLIFVHIGAKAINWLSAKTPMRRLLSAEKVYQWLANSLVSLTTMRSPIPYDMRSLVHFKP